MHVYDAITADATASGTCFVLFYFFNYLLRGGIEKSDACMQKAIEHAPGGVTHVLFFNFLNYLLRGGARKNDTCMRQKECQMMPKAIEHAPRGVMHACNIDKSNRQWHQEE